MTEAKEKKKKAKEKIKWNWPLEKEEFFRSEFLEVTAFFKQKYGIFNSTIQHSTVGWYPEKQAMLREAAEIAIVEIKKNRAKVLADGLSSAIRAAKKGLDIAAESGMPGAQQKAVKTFWHILRTESGLPANITHNTNVNSNTERDDDAADALISSMGPDKKGGEDGKNAAPKAPHSGKKTGRVLPAKPGKTKKRRAR